MIDTVCVMGTGATLRVKRSEVMGVVASDDD